MDDSIPTEEQMRTQMFRTMQAAENAFKAISNHLGGHNVMEVGNTTVFEGDVIVKGNLTVEGVHVTTEQRVEPMTDSSGRPDVIVQCPECAHPACYKDGKRHPTHIQDGCCCEPKIPFSALPPAIQQSMLRGVEIKEIKQTLDQHSKALAVIGSFGKFMQVGFGQMSPAVQIRVFAGKQACGDCTGTGWAARDEQCHKCRGKGFNA